jgi:hypothetical protein
MECLTLLSSFLQDLSTLSDLKIHFEFHPFEEEAIPKDLQPKLDILKNCLSQLLTEITWKNKITDFISCQICRKRFPSLEIRDFHQENVHGSAQNPEVGNIIFLIFISYQYHGPKSVRRKRRVFSQFFFELIVLFFLW